MTKRVLLIDDEAATLVAYKKLLQSPGVRIDTAETIEEAESYLKNCFYHLVISDLRLSGTFEFEGLKILRSIKERATSTVVILLTAYGNSEIKDQALALGAALYLEKPVMADELRNVITNLGVAK